VAIGPRGHFTLEEWIRELFMIDTPFIYLNDLFSAHNSHNIYLNNETIYLFKLFIIN